MFLIMINFHKIFAILVLSACTTSLSFYVAAKPPFLQYSIFLQCFSNILFNEQHGYIFITQRMHLLTTKLCKHQLCVTTFRKTVFFCEIGTFLHSKQAVRGHGLNPVDL